MSFESVMTHPPTMVPRNTTAEEFVKLVVKTVNELRSFVDDKYSIVVTQTFGSYETAFRYIRAVSSDFVLLQNCPNGVPELALLHLSQINLHIRAFAKDADLPAPETVPMGFQAI